MLPPVAGGLAEWLHAGGCPLTPKSAIESHLRFAESFRVHEPVSTSQFAAVAALPSRYNSLRYTEYSEWVKPEWQLIEAQQKGAAFRPSLGP